MKKVFLILLLLIINIKTSFAIPWLIPKDLGLPFETTVSYTVWGIIPHFVQIFIRYVAVIAVLSLMLAWIFYIISWWEEEKVKKAKKWITWSLVWVLLSVSAWWIINLINNLYINN